MEKKNNLENIKDVVNHAYGINPISVSRFNLIFSKFTTTDHHFLVKTKKEIFFVKRYEISNLEKIKNEIRNINKVSNKINIPRIVKTKTKKNYFTASKNIFVLYQYINGKNLKEMRVSLPYFFNVICDIEKKFLKVKTSKQIFDFISSTSFIKNFKYFLFSITGELLSLSNIFKSFFAFVSNLSILE